MTQPPTNRPPSDNDDLVRVEGVGKKFCRDLKKSLLYGMKDIAAELLPGERDLERHAALRPGEFWAVEDVSFELRRGESLGLIGRNGAGKTTLLKMLNGLIKPDKGRIEIRGRVGALIALGAGFNPILTGRENIYVNAAVLGMSTAEVDECIDEIIEFSELSEFIDMPVQSYSSGMAVRLGFSIATALSPDILLLDEVLAVGDIGFQIKCGNRIRELASQCAVVFVSHSMQYVSAFCTRALLVDTGKVVIDALDPAFAIQKYFDQVEISEKVTGTGQITAQSLRFRLSDGHLFDGPLVLDQGATLALTFSLTVSPKVASVKLAIVIVDAAKNGMMFLPVVEEDGSDARFEEGTCDLEIPLGHIELNGGNYSIMLLAQEYASEVNLLRHEGAATFQVRAPNMKSVAKIIRPVRFFPKPAVCQIVGGETSSTKGP